MKDSHNIAEWAKVRETSIEIAQAIFELANNDEVLAEQIWEEGSDEVLPLAFSKTKADRLFWGEENDRTKKCLNNIIALHKGM